MLSKVPRAFLDDAYPVVEGKLCERLQQDSSGSLDRCDSVKFSIKKHILEPYHITCICTVMYY